MIPLPLLQGYPPELQAQARQLLAAGGLLESLARRYPEAHGVHSNRQLFDYVQALKTRHMRNAPPLGRVRFDARIGALENALGLHITRHVTHAGRLRKRRELCVASLFKQLPAAFLRMIVVHELAHMKHSQHDRAFYGLALNMEPDYHQLEFDLRLWLTAEAHPIPVSTRD